MIAIRSLVFGALMMFAVIPFALLGVLTFPFAHRTRYRVITLWNRLVVWLGRVICGMRHEVIGAENLPRGAAVVLAKHLSAWETIAFPVILPPQAFVLKRELLRLPFFGWGLSMLPMIAIDRGAGRDALEQVVEQGSDRLARGWWVVVFPEGTRVAPGAKRRYKPGGAYLAVQAGVPVVPVAHNAGEFWRRNAWLKYPGLITISIGPPIATAGRAAEQVNAEAEAWIEAEMRRLFPHLYGAESGAA